MLFNSYIFILVFLPLCIVGYFGLNHLGKKRMAQAFLLGMSLWFYGFFNPSYLIVILASICVNYGFTVLMGRIERPLLRKLVMIAAVATNLGVLFYFKYFNFFIYNVNKLFALDFTAKKILLPLGISFFTFQQVSYVVDAYRGEVEKYDFIEYASFVAFFPQLIAGPIVSHDELIPQFQDESKSRFSYENFAKGLYLFTLGLAKKVLIADTFGNVVNWGYADVSALDSTNGILVMLGYTFQVYFDFSGYCDMAIGLGKMMNIDLPLNFNSPYKALTITEFWDRWHMTLTRFFTKYVYIPLGGNRKGRIRTYINIMIVYAVSGLWHGASWAFILWGCMHGVYSVVTRHWKDGFQKMHPVFSWLITFAFLNITWIFFRAERMRDAWTLIVKILEMDFGPISYDVVSVFNFAEVLLPVRLLSGLDLTAAAPNLLTGVFYTGTLLCVLGARNAKERMETVTYSPVNMIGIAFLLVWCIFSLSGVSTFLYFNF